MCALLIIYCSNHTRSKIKMYICVSISSVIQICHVKEVNYKGVEHMIVSWLMQEYNSILNSNSMTMNKLKQNLICSSLLTQVSTHETLQDLHGLGSQANRSIVVDD